MKSTPLNDQQERFLAMLAKGYGMSAARREFRAQQWRDMQDLIARGLVRKSSPAPWNKAGAFVITENGRHHCAPLTRSDKHIK